MWEKQTNKGKRKVKPASDMAIGTIFETVNYGELKVIEYQGVKRVRVEFLSTGFKTFSQASHIRRGTVKDLMHPIVFGVGYIGVGSYRAYEGGKATPAYSVWHAMLERCYCPKKHEQFPTYKDCFVCDSWHNFQLFAYWFYRNHHPGLELDKDIILKGNKEYSPEKCKFVTRQQNIENACSKNYIFLNPESKKVEIYNLRKFCRENGLTDECMRRVHNGTARSHKGWAKYV